MFDLNRFVEACREALGEGERASAIREVLAREVADPAGVIAGLGAPDRGGVECLYGSPDITILNVVWAPYMTIMPHNHNMWAVIGVYAGREDNIFWRRLADPATGAIEAAGAKSFGPGTATPLGPDIIHSVTNPTMKLTCGIHIYGGDFMVSERSEWEPETLTESAFTIERSRRLFEQANRRAEAVTAE
jgi:predicted metal-dependent enzyme (double-stranded beta helix superfamily)